MSTPEEPARQMIDALLTQCGWVTQNYKQLDLSAAPGIAIREVRLKEGRCDYLLLIDRKPVGIIEAKKAGVTLSRVADQSSRYAENLPDFLRGNLVGKLPFLYESTGIETYFRDERDPHPRSRRVFAFHRPETLADWLGSAGASPAGFGASPNPHPTLRRLAEMPFKHPYNGERQRFGHAWRSRMLLRMLPLRRSSWWGPLKPKVPAYWPTEVTISPSVAARGVIGRRILLQNNKAGAGVTVCVLLGGNPRPTKTNSRAEMVTAVKPVSAVEPDPRRMGG